MSTVLIKAPDDPQNLIVNIIIATVKTTFITPARDLYVRIIAISHKS